MFDPIDINPRILPTLPLIQRDRLPDGPALYFALSHVDDILYIGKAECLRAVAQSSSLPRVADLRSGAPVVA